MKDGLKNYTITSQNMAVKLKLIISYDSREKADEVNSKLISLTFR